MVSRELNAAIKEIANRVYSDPLTFYAFLQRYISAEAARRQGRHERVYGGILRRGTEIHLGSFAKAIEQ